MTIGTIASGLDHGVRIYGAGCNKTNALAVNSSTGDGAALKSYNSNTVITASRNEIIGKIGSGFSIESRNTHDD